MVMKNGLHSSQESIALLYINNPLPLLSDLPLLIYADAQEATS